MTVCPEHKAGGGNVKITDAPVKFNVQAKIPTASSAAQHKAGGGNVKITNAPVKFNVAAKIPTASSAAQHKAGGGDVKITNAPVKFNVAAKIPTAASAKGKFTAAHCPPHAWCSTSRVQTGPAGDRSLSRARACVSAAPIPPPLFSVCACACWSSSLYRAYRFCCATLGKPSCKRCQTRTLCALSPARRSADSFVFCHFVLPPFCFAEHKAGGGDVKITNAPVKFNVAAKIPTASSAAQHKAGGGNVKITNAPVKYNAGPKIPTAASAAEHKAGGGDVKLHGVARTGSAGAEPQAAAAAAE
jgi:hypothetical protein